MGRLRRGLATIEQRNCDKERDSLVFDENTVFSADDFEHVGDY